MRRSLALLALLFAMPSLATAQEAAKSEANPASGPAPTVISPIFGQLVMFTLPQGFVTVFEQPTAERYIREAVRRGETVDHWSEMITVTGAKGLAAKPGMSAQYFAAQIAAGFKEACPATFTAKPLGPTTISGQEAFIAIASCGKMGTGADTHSETALIVSIKGAADIYTLQWAERTPSNAENLTIDENRWLERLKLLTPIRLCAILPGEKPPYPSCVGK